MPADTIVAFNQSTDMDHLSLICASCANARRPLLLGSAIYEGEEWGGPVPQCCACGAEVDGIVSVPESET